MDNFIKEYYEKIESGEIIVGEYIRKEYKHLYNKLTDNSDGYHFDIDKANKPIYFIETFCRHSKGQWARKPIMLELFQKAFIQALYGFVNKDGIRQYNECAFIVSRKNGKTTLSDGLQLFAAIEEDGAEVYSVATKKDQASISFNEVCNMYSQSAPLQKFFKKRRSDIYSKINFSKIQPLSSDSNTLDGLNASFVLVDELHAITNLDLISVMKQSMSMRRQPILLYNSTNGFVREGPFDITLEYAKKVVDGKINNPRFLPILYLQDSIQEIYNDESSWYKSNPSLGKIKSWSYLRDQFQKSQDSPAERRTTLTKDFNISENTTEAFLNWDDLNNTNTYSLEDLGDSYVIGGFDLAQTDDLTVAGTLIKKNGQYYYHCRCFLPRDLIEQRTAETGIPYTTWRDQGYLYESGTDRIDYSDITDYFLEMQDKYQLTYIKISYDPYNSVYLKKEMLNAGFSEEVLWRCRQGYQTLSSPLKQMGVDLKAKLINYNNNPIVKWCLSNIAVKQDINNNIMPYKKNNETLKIDAAAVMLFCFCAIVHNIDDIGTLMD